MRELKARFEDVANAGPDSQQARFGFDFERLEAVRREFGFDQIELELPADFDDPAFSRRVLGLPN